MNHFMTAAGCAALGFLIAQPAMAACSLKTQPISVTMQGAVPAVNTGLPVVDVKVNGKASKFLLQSSSPVNEISAKFASSQKLAPTKAADSGPQIVTVPKFEIAGAAIANAPFVVSNRLAGDMDGQIGQTFLGQMDVEYDLAGGKVMLAKADGCETSNMAYWAKDGDMYWEMPLVPAAGGIPLTQTKITVNGAALTALFDTSAPYSIITKAAAEKAGVKTSDPSVKPIRGSSDRWLGNFAVNVGGEEAKNAPLMIAQSADSSYDVLIGADYFLTHHLYVANSQRKIYATRAGLPGAPSFAAHQPPANGMSTGADSQGRLGNDHGY
jgi:hypothetical protein